MDSSCECSLADGVGGKRCGQLYFCGQYGAGAIGDSDDWRANIHSESGGGGGEFGCAGGIVGFGGSGGRIGVGDGYADADRSDMDSGCECSLVDRVRGEWGGRLYICG